MAHVRVKDPPGGTCYACDRQATGRDHLPPRVFFPKALRGVGQLFSLPACNLHNGDQSNDDETTAYGVVCHEENDNSEPALQQVREHLAPALEKHPGLVPKVFRQGRIVERRGYETIAFKVDYRTAGRTFTRISRGLFYRHTETKLQLPLTWISPSLVGDDGQPSANYQRVDEIVLGMKERKDENAQVFEGCVGSPGIFQYMLVRNPKNLKTFVLRLVFYGGFRVAVLAPQPHANPERVFAE